MKDERALFHKINKNVTRKAQRWYVSVHICRHARVSRFGLAVRRYTGKQKDRSLIPLRLSFLFRKVVVCGHWPVTVHHFLLKH